MTEGHEAISTGERHHRADVVAFPETCNRPHYDYNLDDLRIWNVFLIQAHLVSWN